MSNLSNVTAELSGGKILVRGNKGTAVTVRAYLNPNLSRYPTNRDLYNGYPEIATPKDQDSSTGDAFDLSLPLDGVAAPYRVRVVSSDGKSESPVIEETHVDVGRPSA